MSGSKFLSSFHRFLCPVNGGDKPTHTHHLHWEPTCPVLVSSFAVFIVGLPRYTNRITLEDFFKRRNEISYVTETPSYHPSHHDWKLLYQVPVRVCRVHPHLCVCVCVWDSEYNGRYCASVVSHLLFETGLLIGLELHHIGSAPARLPASASCLAIP